jgi:hypothetical protein
MSIINAKINGGSFCYLQYGGDIQLSRFPSVFQKYNFEPSKSFAFNVFTIGSIVMELVLEITDHHSHNIPMLTFLIGFSYIISNRYFIELLNG